MKIEELYQKILAIVPGAEFGEDFMGQLVIYTNLQEKEGNVVPFEEEEPTFSDDSIDYDDCFGCEGNCWKCEGRV